MKVVRSRWWIVGLAMLSFVTGQVAHAAPVKKTPTVPVVMLNDLHFDPFHDPAKFDRLRSAPAEAWQAILSEPDASTQPADFAKLMGACKVRGVDTPWALLESSLRAAHEHSPHALFVTVAGDLLVHKFDCRFHLMAKGASEADYSAFTAKTLAYVASELHRAFPRTPVYMALGNNDSGCADYREDSGSAFLQSAGETSADAAVSPQEHDAIVKLFPATGSYSVALPKPIVRGRLIVLQDMFLSREFAGCNGKANPAPGKAQLEWLRNELTAARDRHEQVWFMAHIPPGVNVYSTVTTNRNVCGGQTPVMFLRDEKLVETLTDFAPEVRLALFGHTHNDEMRLLQGTGPDAGRVAAKLTPAVTPINGNNPAFTLADVDPKTAVLVDYRVIGGSNPIGVDETWTEEYRYSTLYREPAYTPASLARLLTAFTSDKAGTTSESASYEDHFMVGGGLRALAIKLVWPQYACSLGNNTEAGYRACACPVTPHGK